MHKLFGVILFLFAAGLFGIGKYNYDQIYYREEENLRKEVEQLKQSQQPLNPAISDEEIHKIIMQQLETGGKEKATKPLSDLIYQRAKAKTATVREFTCDFRMPYSLMEAILLCSGVIGIVLFSWGVAVAEAKRGGSQLNF